MTGRRGLPPRQRSSPYRSGPQARSNSRPRRSQSPDHASHVPTPTRDGPEGPRRDAIDRDAARRAASRSPAASSSSLAPPGARRVRPSPSLPNIGSTSPAATASTSRLPPSQSLPEWGANPPDWLLRPPPAQSLRSTRSSTRLRRSRSPHAGATAAGPSYAATLRGATDEVGREAGDDAWTAAAASGARRRTRLRLASEGAEADASPSTTTTTPPRPPSSSAASPGSGESRRRRRRGASRSRSPASVADSERAVRRRPAGGRTSVTGLGERQYRLTIVQTPTTGCAFGSNLLSRLPLAPPLIAQVSVLGVGGVVTDAEDEVPFLVANLALLTDSGQPTDMLLATDPSRGDRSGGSGPTRPSTPQSASAAQAGVSYAAVAASTPTSSQQQSAARMLYGTLAAGATSMLDMGGRPGAFFCFPEVSVRAVGRYRLRINLVRLPVGPMSGTTQRVLASVATEPFEVVLTSDYVAPEITETTRHFARQGVGLLLPPNAALQS